MWVNAKYNSPTNKVILDDGEQDYMVICDDRALDIFTQVEDTIFCLESVLCCQTYDMLEGQSMQDYVNQMFSDPVFWEPEGE